MLKIDGIEGKSSQLDRALAYTSAFQSGVANTIGAPTPNLKTTIDPATGDIVSYFTNIPHGESQKN